MPRRTTVTVTATAVTLTLLGASLYLSPPVIAETLGREVETFSPLKPQTHPLRAESTQLADNATAADGRTYSVLGSQHADTEPTTSEPAPQVNRQVERLGFVPEQTVSDPEDQSVPASSTQPSDLPSVEVALPEIVAEEPTPQSTETAQTIPEDLDSPDSVTVIVNKRRPLPADYEPADLVDLPETFATGGQRLREEAADAAVTMLEAAASEGIQITVISAYRSYDYQQRLYNNYVEQFGVAAANKISARQGHSEHQTGLAIDVDTLSGEHRLKTSFGDTAAGQWLAENAHEYGFVVRYPQNEQDTTGFSYEPWHLRYFGTTYAQQISENSGVTEQEFQLEPAPDYVE